MRSSVPETFPDFEPDVIRICFRCIFAAPSCLACTWTALSVGVRVAFCRRVQAPIRCPQHHGQGARRTVSELRVSRRVLRFPMNPLHFFRVLYRINTCTENRSPLMHPSNSIKRMSTGVRIPALLGHRLRSITMGYAASCWHSQLR